MSDTKLIKCLRGLDTAQARLLREHGKVQHHWDRLLYVVTGLRVGTMVATKLLSPMGSSKTVKAEIKGISVIGIVSPAIDADTDAYNSFIQEAEGKKVRPCSRLTITLAAHGSGLWTERYLTLREISRDLKVVKP